MISIYIFFMILISIGAYVFFTWIKTAYREYDRKETLKEDIVINRARIKMALEYFRNTYDLNVYSNIKTNVDFCLNLILNNESSEKRLEGLKNLFHTLYETGYRLKTKYDDVNYILAPMKNLREKLVIELTDYLKENSDDLL